MAVLKTKKKKDNEKSLAAAITTGIQEGTPEQKARKALEEARLKIEDIVKEYGIEIGVWFKKDDVERLHQTFIQLPGIVEYKIEAQLRKN